MPGRRKVVLKLSKAKAFALALALAFLLVSPTAAGKPPTLNYDVIVQAPPSTSTHPPVVNDDPTRGCFREDYCRSFTLSFVNPSGTRFVVNVTVKRGSPLNSSAPGTEAIAAAMAKWYLNHTSLNSSRLLIVSVNSTAGADSSEKLHQQAVSRGIARMGLQVQFRHAKMSGEDMTSLPPVGDIVMRVDAASTLVDLKFFTQVESFGKINITQILKYAQVIIQS